MLNWKNDIEFEIDGINFTIDITPGPKRRESETENFTLVKTKSFINQYLSMTSENFGHILELGIFQGGSLVFFDKIFKPNRMVGLDIMPNKIPALENYIKSNATHIKTYYKSSQGDERLLQKIVKDDLEGQLDLVVDDASHLYELTKESFSVLFPLLRAGGTYLIEDWAWSHRENAQTSKHPWHKKPALTNLLFEIINEFGGGKEIEHIYINNDLIRIRKAASASSGSVFQNPALRGRAMPLI